MKALSILVTFSLWMGAQMAMAQKLTVSVQYEAFSLDLAPAAALLRKQPGDKVLYRTICDLVDSKEAKLEAFKISRGVENGRSKSQSGKEQIYPTATASPQTPYTLSVAGSQLSPAVPNTFSKSYTRSTDLLMEVEPTLFDDRSDLLDVRIDLQHIALGGYQEWGLGTSRVQMPEFEKQGIVSYYTVPINKPFLIGTLNRPPGSKVEAGVGHRVWFVFITVQPLKP